MVHAKSHDVKQPDGMHALQRRLDEQLLVLSDELLEQHGAPQVADDKRMATSMCGNEFHAFPLPNLQHLWPPICRCHLLISLAHPH